MPANYVLLEKITVGAAGASSVTFSSIPQTGYTDLVVKMSTRTSASSITGRVYVAFNGVGTNQTRRLLLGNGSSASSGSASDIATDRGTGNSATASTFANMEMYIPNYTSANFKSVSIDAVGENNATEAYAGLIAGLWSSTAAITAMTLSSSDGGNFMQGTTFYLYGVAKLGTTPVIVPYATGGDTIMTDGTYWYHTFTSSGTFTPAKALSCDYLVVAGGGGGARWAGGGGAGGLRSTVGATGGGGSLESKLSLGTSAYTVTIGAGGVGAIGSSPQYRGTNGSNSVFSTITSNGGGGGASFSGGGLPLTGGSGGGGNSGSVAGVAGAAGDANQGYAGGTGQTGNFLCGGGGGGAGAVGANGVNGGASGGAGVTTNISGSSVTYAGGGGGSGQYTAVGTGGAGGGGSGVLNANATAGTVNTGGGGGGGYSQAGVGDYNGGNGGSGIVIVRYAV
jgi:hypothetical protein